MTEKIHIIDTTSDNIHDYGVCGYKSMKRPGYPEKVAWLEDRFKEGLKIKTLYSEEDGTQGMIEYLPGECCWRPVEADGYLFIHCLFVGFKKKYKIITLVIFVAYYIMAHLPFQGLARYQIPIVPLLAIISSITIMNVVQLFSLKK